MSTSVLDRAVMPLSQRLREGTQDVHSEAESVTFISDLMGGRLRTEAYADLAAQQYGLYRALESASEQMRHTARGRDLVFDDLTRTPSIEADLEYLFGARWRERIDVLEVSQDYAEHIAAVGHELPRYAAHAYTRYLGDLSGGQAIKRLVQRHYGLGEDGLRFYTFEAIAKPKIFKDTYRARLDALALSEDEIEVAVAESRVAFDFATTMFAALGERHQA